MSTTAEGKDNSISLECNPWLWTMEICRGEQEKLDFIDFVYGNDEQMRLRDTCNMAKMAGSVLFMILSLIYIPGQLKVVISLSYLSICLTSVLRLIDR